MSDADDILSDVEGDEAVDKVRDFAWARFVEAMESDLSFDNPHVGIFWLVGSRLLTSTTPLLQADQDGQFLVHGTDHFAIWENWQRFSAKALAMHGLPPEIAWTNHENHPRGRIVFCWSAPAFIVYADHSLLDSDATMVHVIDAFGLDRGRCLLRLDKSYHAMK